MAKLTKEQGTTISLSAAGSAIAAFATAIAAVWGFAAPIAQKAMAGEIKDEISRQIQPIQKQISNQTLANIITITTTVKNLQKQITALEFKRDACKTPECWTVRDAEDLQAAKDDLIAAKNALAALNLQ